MTKFILLVLPTILYLGVQSRRQPRSVRCRAALDRAGVALGPASAHRWALLLLPPLVLMGWLRHRTGTFLPGAAVHAAVNIAMGPIAA